MAGSRPAGRSRRRAGPAQGARPRANAADAGRQRASRRAHRRRTKANRRCAMPGALFDDVLGWEAQHVAGSPGGPPLPDDVHVRLPEHATTLSPTWAVKELGNGDRPWQLLVRIEPAGIDPDARGTARGLGSDRASALRAAAARDRRLRRLLISEKNDAGRRGSFAELRLIYAPRGETSGHLSFPLRALATVAGRPMLGGLKLLLDSFRLFADADRSPPSRAAQEKPGGTGGGLHRARRAGAGRAARAAARARCRRARSHPRAGARRGPDISMKACSPS